MHRNTLIGLLVAFLTLGICLALDYQSGPINVGACDSTCMRRLFDRVAYASAAQGIVEAMTAYQSYDWCIKQEFAWCPDAINSTLATVAGHAALSLSDAELANCGDDCLLSTLSTISSKAALAAMVWVESTVNGTDAGKEPAYDNQQTAAIQGIQRTMLQLDQDLEEPVQVDSKALSSVIDCDCSAEPRAIVPTHPSQSPMTPVDQTEGEVLKVHQTFHWHNETIEIDTSISINGAPVGDVQPTVDTPVQAESQDCSRVCSMSRFPAVEASSSPWKASGNRNGSSARVVAPTQPRYGNVSSQAGTANKTHFLALRSLPAVQPPYGNHSTRYRAADINHAVPQYRTLEINHAVPVLPSPAADVTQPEQPASHADSVAHPASMQGDTVEISRQDPGNSDEDDDDGPDLDPTLVNGFKGLTLLRKLPDAVDMALKPGSWLGYLFHHSSDSIASSLSSGSNIFSHSPGSRFGVPVPDTQPFVNPPLMPLPGPAVPPAPPEPPIAPITPASLLGINLPPVPPAPPNTPVTPASLPGVNLPPGTNSADLAGTRQAGQSVDGKRRREDYQSWLYDEAQRLEQLERDDPAEFVKQAQPWVDWINERQTRKKVQAWLGQLPEPHEYKQLRQRRADRIQDWLVELPEPDEYAPLPGEFGREECGRPRERVQRVRPPTREERGRPPTRVTKLPRVLTVKGFAPYTIGMQADGAVSPAQATEIHGSIDGKVQPRPIGADDALWAPGQAHGLGGSITGKPPSPQATDSDDQAHSGPFFAQTTAQDHSAASIVLASSAAALSGFTSSERPRTTTTHSVDYLIPPKPTPTLMKSKHWWGAHGTGYTYGPHQAPPEMPPDVIRVDANDNGTSCIYRGRSHGDTPRYNGWIPDSDAAIEMDWEAGLRVSKVCDSKHEKDDRTTEASEDGTCRPYWDPVIKRPGDTVMPHYANKQCVLPLHLLLPSKAQDSKDRWETIFQLCADWDATIESNVNDGKIEVNIRMERHSDRSQRHDASHSLGWWKDSLFDWRGS